MTKRAFVPQTEAIEWQSRGIRTLKRCANSDRHDQYCSLGSLDIEDLPQNWRHEKVLEDFKSISKRIVHLTVLEMSPERQVAPNSTSHTGTGFITLHPTHGAVVHTSKHVVYDPFEAERTIVRLFYDGQEDNTVYTSTAQEQLRDLILNRVPKDEPLLHDLLGDATRKGLLCISRGSRRHFRSVMCSDYTAFTCQTPVHELFVEREQALAQQCFSWRMFGLRRVLCAPQADFDVAVISHPHGMPKKISFGKMTRLASVAPSLYTAPTCCGSSGAPVIRMHVDSGHYLSAGQFVHHGYNRERLDMGMGTVRPPVTFPYWRLLDSESGLVSFISLLYEPVFYWTLFACDLLHVSSTLTNVLDVFAYTSSFSAFAFSVESWPFRILFCCFWAHVLVTIVHFAVRAGPYFALCNLIGQLITMSSFLIGWSMLFFMPWPMSNMFVVSAVWTVAIYCERHFHLSYRFSNMALGDFSEWLQYKLVSELGHKARESKSSDLDTAEPTGDNSVRRVKE